MLGASKGVRRATRFLVTMNNFHIIKNNINNRPISNRFYFNKNLQVKNFLSL